MNIIIHTQVYNGEKTLSRTIESIINQTYKNFIYYISDNASTDGTVAIIEKYAKKDERIIPAYNKTNEFYAYHNNVKECSKKYPDGYWAMLDADDEYVPEFLEVMISYIKSNDLDIATCGIRAIDEETKKVKGYRQIHNDVIISGSGFCDHFCEYHTFMRNVCTKLFSLQLLNKCTFETVKGMSSYGGDTIFAIEAFANAKRVGILRKALHNVYFTMSSVSSRWESNRTDSILIRDEFTREFLIKKCGKISPKNENFLHGVYFGSIKETLPVLFNPKLKLDYTDKVKYLNNMLSHEKTQEVLRVYSHEKLLDTDLRIPVVNWLLLQENCRMAEGAISAAEIIIIIYPKLSCVVGHDELMQFIMNAPDTLTQILNEYSSLGL